MKLKDIINVIGSGEWLRIATESGKRWIIYTTTEDIGAHPHLFPEYAELGLGDREVT